MKVTLQQEPGAETEVIIRYDRVDADVQALLDRFSSLVQRIQGYRGDEMRMLRAEEILYCESVDGKTFAYTTADVYTVRRTLSDIAADFEGPGFFRCSKSMVLNLHALDSLKCGANGRIIATLQNGERLLVSRQYARLLRTILKGGLE